MNNYSSFSLKKIFKIIGKVLSWALFVILLIIAAFLLYYYIATKNYAAKGPGYEPKYSIYTIISGSMYPEIKVYDTIINEKVSKPEDIKKGDIITFISSALLTPGTTITHRVVDITQDEAGNICYKTKGDFNPVEDQSCAKFSNVIGRVVLKIPQLGRLQFFLASKMGWMLCILIPALVIIIRDILRITKLNTIKTKADIISANKPKNDKQTKLEQKRKAELKRKLLKENKEKVIYFEEPKIIKKEAKRKKK